MTDETFIKEVVPLSPKLKRVAVGYLHDEETASDLVQEVLLMLWINRVKLVKYRSIEALAVTITKHRSIDVLRKHKNDCSLDYAGFELSEETTDRAIERSELSQQIQRAIEKLPRLQRLCFYMKEVEGYESDEIAQILGVDASAVYNHLSRARKRLREMLISLSRSK